MRGSVFLPGSTDRAIADIEAGPLGLHATLLDGSSLSARWSDLTAHLGGQDHQMVFLSVAHGPTVCLDAQFLPTLRAAAGASHAHRFAAFQQHARSVHRRFHLAVAAAIISVIAVLGGLVLAIPWAAQRAVVALPISIDRDLGDAGYAQMDLGGRKVQPEVAVKALDAMVQRLAAHATPSGFAYRVQIVDADQVNAFALPGGQIVVYTGLLKKATRPEQVAGVLAHEMAHVTKRHGLQGVAKQVGVVVGAQVLLGDASSLGSIVGQGAMAALLNGYSRDAEREADAEGLRLLLAAGIDPHGLPEFFGLLKGESGSELPGMLTWLSTHPEHDERVANLTAQIAAAPAPTLVPLAVDWPAVQAAVAHP